MVDKNFVDTKHTTCMKWITNMNNLQELKDKKESLEKERTRLLRGFGGRYSYTHRLKSDPEGNKQKLKNNRKRIKKVKDRLVELEDEIYEVRKAIERAEIMNVRSSENFDSSFSDTMKSFDG